MDHIRGVLAKWSGSDDDAQVLGVTKQGAIGIRNINAMVQASVSPGNRSSEVGSSRRAIRSSTLRTTTSGTARWAKSKGSWTLNGGPSLLCWLDGTQHEITEGNFHRIDLAYAITVHIAQASQFKRVIVPVVKSRLLDRTMIYTALTRGIEHMVLLTTGTHSTRPSSRRMARNSGSLASRCESGH
jgi:exodeoxyribonuclease V alpha subunit